MILSYFLFFFVLMFLIFFNVHYMVLLLLLEALLLSIFLYVCWSFLVGFSFIGLFMFLLLMVCMGGFSISLLVSLSRFFGRDFWYFKFVF